MNAKAMSLKAKIKNYAIKNYKILCLNVFWQGFHDLSTVKCL